jgi:hypothetical protein
MTIWNGVPGGLQERDAANRGGQGQAKQKNETASADPGAGSASEAIIEKVSTGENTTQHQAGHQKEANKDPIVRYTRWLSCNFKPHDPDFDARMTTDTVFLAGKISYEDWVQHHTHVTEFGHRMVITSLGRDNRFMSMSVTTEPAGEHNCADEDCPGYIEEGPSWL